MSFFKKIKKVNLQYAIAFLILTAAFQFNLFNTTSDFQFKTWRDGSEALVLGNIFAKSHDVNTPHSNMGFIEKGEITKGSNVLAVYSYIDYPEQIMTSRVTDANWNNGLSRFENKFLLDSADVAKLGYASNEFINGQTIELHDGSTHRVTNVSHEDKYLVVQFDGDRVDTNNIPTPYGIKTTGGAALVFDPYPQQVGIQSIALSWLHQHTPLANSVFSMQLLMSLAMALTLTLLIREYAFSVSPLFALTFFICIAGSPWVVAIARNLYWAAFLWFLPALAAMIVYRSKNRALALAGYCLAVFIKCLAGYEYISSVVLLSLLIFMVAPFFRQPKFTFWPALKLCILVGLTACLGFLLAVTLHSYMRADNFIDGISQTLGWDALKYSALGRYTGAVQDSALRPLGGILSDYIFHWRTPVLFWPYSQLVFPALLALATGSLALQLCLRDKNFMRDAALVIFSSLAPLSWLILMQNHSAVHVHLNYVLWYFGFIPAVGFVIIRGPISIVKFFQRKPAGQLVRNNI